MIGEVVRLHYGYNAWATERILAAAEGVAAEQLNADGVAGNGSIRTTLLHLIDRQQAWFAWFDGSLPADEAIVLHVDPDMAPDVAGLRTVWEQVNVRTMHFIDAATDDEFNRCMHLEFPNGLSKDVPLWNLLLHVANHGTQHRSEVAAMLTEHGCSPGSLDMLFYLLDPSTAGKAG
jgi:uncharacterized damage-inducible protein DinB